MKRQAFMTYCQSEFSMQADHPFKRDPEIVALRHPNGKWFALVMHVAYAKLGLPGDDSHDIVNLKVEPELNSILQIQPGFFPGYHMNKTHWLSVQLDQFERPEILSDLIEGSYQATR